MKTNIYLIAIICITLFSNAGCVKTPTPPSSPLVAATQTGANTFGCFIDDEACNVTGAYASFFQEGVGYGLYSDGTLIIKAVTTDHNKNFYLFAKIKNGIIGTHQLNEYLNGYSSFRYYNIGDYSANENLAGTITITKYTGDITKNSEEGQILSGTFDIIMQDANGKKVHLRDGRFDISAKK
jgi:hypothetical protein